MPTTHDSTTSPPARLFAIIPAAGLSRRMGRPKLTLDLGGKSVLERLSDALNVPEIAGRVIVIRKNDDDLLEQARSLAGLTIVTPAVDPPDMRASVGHALNEVRDRFAPQNNDGWMLIPADHPCLNRTLLKSVIETWHRERPAILVPTHREKRGHPTIFRWSLAEEVDRLPPDTGLNSLVQRHASDVLETEIDDAGILTDLDTPADYEKLREAFE